jgi:hypothetical protein
MRGGGLRNSIRNINISPKEKDSVLVSVLECCWAAV